LKPFFYYYTGSRIWVNSPFPITNAVFLSEQRFICY